MKIYLSVTLFGVFASVCFGNTSQNICDGEIENCDCRVYEVHCQGADLRDVRKLYQYVTEEVEVISLTNCGIEEVPDRLFMNLKPKLSVLKLSGNSIYQIYPSAFQNVPNLDVLDLRNNQINYFTPENIDAFKQLDLQELYIGQNSYDCNCFGGENATEVILDWMKTSDYLADKEELQCAYGRNDSVIGRPVVELTARDLCYPPEIIICPGPDPGFTTRKAAFYAVIAAGLFLIVAFTAFVAAICRRRRTNKSPVTASPAVVSADMSRPIEKIPL